MNNPSPVTDHDAWILIRLRRHVTEMLRLAAPIVVNRFGILLIVAVDAAMVGRYAVEELAYQAIGLATIIPVMLAGLGMVMGTLVVTANAFGSGDYAGCGRAWRRGQLLTLLLGAGLVVYCTFGETVLTAFGQAPDLSAGGGRVMLAIGIGMPAQLMFMNAGFFLEAIRRPLPGMIVMLSGNALNAALNWLVLYGDINVGTGGAEGVAWATTVARWSMALVMIVYIWWMKDRDVFSVRHGDIGPMSAWTQQRRIGYATAISIGVEAVGFAAMSIFAGWLGVLPLGGYTIAQNILALIFMASIGVGAATSVRVSIAHGRRDVRDLALAGWTGLGMNTVVMIVGAGIFAAFPHFSASIYTNDPELIFIAVPMIILLLYVMVFDGGQAVLANALRGRQDVWVPSILQIFTYLGVMVPMGYVLAFHFEHGARGLMEGILLASAVSSILLGSRFHLLARRDRETLAESST